MNSRLLLVSGLLAASAQAKVPVSKLAAEWLVPHSTDPNAFTLVDTATGTVRPGAMKASGTVGWRNPVATGVTNVSAVCAAVPAAVGEAVAVALELLAPGQQLVRGEHRLGPPQVRVAGDQGVGVALGLVEQGPLQAQQIAVDGIDLATQPEAQVGAHLVVAGAAGVELLA